MNLRPLLLTATLLAACSLPAAAQTTSAGDPRGRWVTGNGNLEVEIAACGVALCGTVTQVLGNRSMSGSGAAMTPVDGRPALGLKILSGFVPLDAGRTATPAPARWQGEIYNRENGKTYACRMSVDTAGDAQGELVLRGYVGLPLFGQTQRWRRAARPAPALSSSTSAPDAPAVR